MKALATIAAAHLRTFFTSPSLKEEEEEEDASANRWPVLLDCPDDGGGGGGEVDAAEEGSGGEFHSRKGRSASPQPGVPLGRPANEDSMAPRSPHANSGPL